FQRGIFAMQQACPDCGGRGQVVRNPCRKCHGAGRIEDEKVLSVKIPAGVDSGDRIRLTGEGEAGPPGTPPGDLYVEVRVREHAIFTRDGDDLHCEVPIRISQAALGDVVNVPTLGGEAEIRIPAETQTGKTFRLRGKGVRSVRSRAPGDLYCRVVVETPVNLTAEQRELLEKFEATFRGEEGRRHSPLSATFLDGVKSFWGRMTSASAAAPYGAPVSRASISHGPALRAHVCRVRRKTCRNQHISVAAETLRTDGPTHALACAAHPPMQPA